VSGRLSEEHRALPFAAGQVVTVFRNRLHEPNVARYAERAAEIHALAMTMPGLVDVKTFTAEDGERVTIATFADAEAQRTWREHEEHRAAQREGRDDFYDAYTLQVCETVRARTFTRP
jgi:heme-degrading monooxygenase HmoA